MLQQRRAVSNNALIPSKIHVSHGLRSISPAPSPNPLRQSPSQHQSVPQRPNMSTNLPPNSQHFLLRPAGLPLPLPLPLPLSHPNLLFHPSPSTYLLHHYLTTPRQLSTLDAAWKRTRPPATPLLPTAQRWERFPSENGLAPLILKRQNASMPKLPSLVTPIHCSVPTKPRRGRSASASCVVATPKQNNLLRAC